jgi:hypothetical protein
MQMPAFNKGALALATWMVCTAPVAAAPGASPQLRERQRPKPSVIDSEPVTPTRRLQLGVELGGRGAFVLFPSGPQGHPCGYVGCERPSRTGEARWWKPRVMRRCARSPRAPCPSRGASAAPQLGLRELASPLRAPSLPCLLAPAFAKQRRGSGNESASVRAA